MVVVWTAAVTSEERHLAEWRAANQCDHGPDCPVWVAQWLQPEDLEELGAGGWSYPTRHQVPAAPSKKPRLGRVTLWFVVWALAWGGWTLWTESPLRALVAILIVASVYGFWAKWALTQHRDEHH